MKIVLNTNKTQQTALNLIFKAADRVFFKNKQPGKWNLKWRAGYRIVYIQHNRHYFHIGNQAKEKTRSCKV